MRKLLLSLLVIGTVAAIPSMPASAMPAGQPVLGAILGQDAAVQPVQYRYSRREAIRRQEIRRRQALRRQDFRRRQAFRPGYRY